jgi:Na+/melibiose symporter-like transporter
LLSAFFFLTQYLQGVLGYSPLQAGLAFLPLTALAFGAASLVPWLSRRMGNALVAAAGIAAMLIGTAVLSRVSVDTPYLAGIALPMVVFGAGQALGLSTLTNAGMTGVSDRDAGAAGGVVNAAHHLGGAVGLGILVTVFAAAGSGALGAREQLAQQVGAALAGATIFLFLSLLVVLITRPRKSSNSSAREFHPAPDAMKPDLIADLTSSTKETRNADHEEFPRDQSRPRRLVHR